MGRSRWSAKRPANGLRNWRSVWTTRLTAHALIDDFATDRKLRAESLPLYVKLFGNDHRRTIDARLALERATVLEKLSPEDRRELARGKELNDKFMQLYSAGKYREALAPALDATEISRKILGPASPEYASALDGEALLYKLLGELAKAEQLATDALAIYKQAVGEKHPYYAGGLDILAEICMSRGVFAKAEPLYRQSMAIRKALFGSKHPDYARSLNNLAVLLDLVGDYAKAEPLYRQALDIRKTALGEKHPLYALTLHNLAGLYASVGDDLKAEALYRQALEIRKQVLGEQHPDYAATLAELAALYRRRRDYARAEPLYRQALAIRKATFGEKHPVYAAALNNLGMLYLDMRDFAKAEPLLISALEISKSALGAEHPEYASNLSNVAALYRAQGRLAKAISSQAEVLQIDRRVRGEQSLYTAEDAYSLAVLEQLNGDEAKAAQLFLAALHVYRDQLDLTAAVQSERQQLLLLKDAREILRSLMSAGDGAKLPLDQLYAELLTWKGSVAVRQQAIRQLSAEKSPETKKLVNELKQKSRALAKLSLSLAEPGQEIERRERLVQLTDEVEQAQQALAAQSAAFRSQLDLQRVAPADVQRALPDSVALVDFFEYFRYLRPEERTGKSHWDFQLVAFVVRNKSIERVELGPVLPIYEAIRMWRRAFVPLTTDEAPLATDPVPRDKQEPARRLRQLVWDKLDPDLAGVKTVLISPDGITARFPWSATPGKKPGTYLIEEMAVGIVPIPRLLAQVSNKQPAGKSASAAERTNPTPSLLVVGDVNYDAIADSGPDSALAMSAPRIARSGQLLHWQSLDATRPEMAAIADSFEQTFPDGKIERLRGGEATKAALVADIESHRYIHLATHGFFSPKELKSALDSGGDLAEDPGGQQSSLRSPIGYPPGLLSGLVLAGANQPAAEGKDDGVLTALEVAQLNLSHVELATLSACETGLGDLAGGEGVLGLQRAFQIAGAKSVVSTLWRVNDDATRTLMIDFYDNLWRKKLTKIEALRQAQLKMLRMESLASGPGRGLKFDDSQSPDENRRLPPYYWAPFVLSGDWR